jgi:hypothetical protein
MPTPFTTPKHLNGLPLYDAVDPLHDAAVCIHGAEIVEIIVNHPLRNVQVRVNGITLTEIRGINRTVEIAQYTASSDR